jgi:DNA-binding CsgD family transcriptional regulator
MLSPREIKVAELISQGMIEKEIADQMNLAPATVHTYKYRILNKLSVHNIADITREYLLKYDTAIQNRINRSYRNGRRVGLIAGWHNSATNQPKSSIQDIRTQADNGAPAARQAESNQARKPNLFQHFRTGKNHKSKYMKQDEMMKKIDRMFWLQQNCTVAELDRLIQIADELIIKPKANENKS